ncbi:MAG: 1-acyl-sn-glycerol-3-phosphate acyltransferase [Ruminiclostridium sp.]|nr:1-acyl-sn-glycerol-3-phosphate acyltransferase [Ruminiclostridium sp.]
MKIDQLISREKIVILKDLHTRNTSIATIYACAHIGGNDIQRAFQVINDPSYLMLGDPGILYRMPIYLGLKLNGVIPLETNDKTDRKIAYARAIELLNSGGNLLIYPEGAWNVSPNLIMMKTFTGTVRMAQETNAEIVPIAMEQYGDKFIINIGKNYRIPQNSYKNTDELNQELRCILATLKWDIMESQELSLRANIPKDYLDDFQTEIIGRCNFGYGFTLEDALKEAFHDKNVTNSEDVFAHMNALIPNGANTFLYNKRNHY